MDTARENLEVWGGAMARALEDMLADVRAGMIYGHELDNRFAYIRHLMQRHDGLVSVYQAYKPRRNDTPKYARGDD